jgi:hypothetical protein
MNFRSVERELQVPCTSLLQVEYQVLPNNMLPGNRTGTLILQLQVQVLVPVLVYIILR